jgi:hypothetical protein
MKTPIKTALKTLTLCAATFLGAVAFAPTQALAAEPIYNDEGALVDTSGPMKELTFVDGDTLEGEVLGLVGDDIYSPRGRHHASLIPIKFHFIPELIALSWDAPTFY